MQLAVLAAAFIILGATSAMAQQQQQQPVDQRLVAPAMTALQAMLALREAELKALAADYEARLETAMQWLKAAQAKAPASK